MSVPTIILLLIVYAMACLAWVPLGFWAAEHGRVAEAIWAIGFIVFLPYTIVAITFALWQTYGTRPR